MRRTGEKQEDSPRCGGMADLGSSVQELLNVSGRVASYVRVGERLMFDARIDSGWTRFRGQIRAFFIRKCRNDTIYDTCAGLGRNRRTHQGAEGWQISALQSKNRLTCRGASRRMCVSGSVLCAMYTIDSGWTRFRGQIRDDERLLVEPACGAALAAIYSPVISRLQDQGRLPGGVTSVVVVVCGGNNITLKQLETWKGQLGLT
uniref:L-serine ammonia-lyase n=1 Tax=Branchiostoma floridae TaxID=7739 RepID=C3ZL74_BRAFL|eukprot:XP_002590745.1 hypothetical protein BRAFLDRAFT_78159 [Branchiostoma floridae]